MKLHVLSHALLGFLLAACSQLETASVVDEMTFAPQNVPEVVIEKTRLEYHHQSSRWTYDAIPYSGYAVTYFPDGSLQERFGVLDGKRQGEYLHWFADGQLRNVANYHEGKLHGAKKVWIQDSAYVLISHLNYKAGKPHGKQTKWYPSGELFKVLHLNEGREEGIQQAFRKNGDRYANYEAREGRIFGLKKSKLCYSLEEEQLKATSNLRQPLE